MFSLVDLDGLDWWECCECVGDCGVEISVGECCWVNNIWSKRLVALQVPHHETSRHVKVVLFVWHVFLAFTVD